MPNLLYYSLLLLIIFPIVGKCVFDRKAWAGILLCLALAAPAWYLGQSFKIVGGPVFGILFGIVVALFLQQKPFCVGSRLTSRKLLQAAIVLLGFEMNMRTVLEVGEQSLLIMVFTLSAAFLTAYFVSKALRIESKVATLIGVGTAICGGSAIAATAPVIDADMDQVASSISTIFMFNVMAVFIFPAVGHLIGLTDMGFGMWAGTAINDTSSVVAAGWAYSPVAGQFATIVKLTRTLAIIPITFILALYTTRQRKTGDSSFNLLDIFPWFILGFVAAAIVNSVGIIPASLASFLGRSGKFFIVAAMAGIGLNTNIRSLLANSRKSILLGAICWFAVAVTSLIVQYFMGML
jgi:uncharacterized integral membrane protein (TIGR00698 family)